MATAKKRVLSGIQPSGMVHIGNYLGAVKNWVESQDRFENFFCIVDQHVLTLPHDPKALRAQKRELAGVLFAAGIDPEKSVLFIQSQVPAHSELAWILACVASMGQLKRMTQFKEKSEKIKEEASVGLFTYPVLMAADILLYQANSVPVGDDQKQHVELTRDLAQRFNNHYGVTFVIPEPTIPPVGARIMGLDDPTKKMSKSEDKPGHAVGVLDTPDEIRKKFKSAVTDSKREIVFDSDRPGLFNLLTIYQVFTGKDKATIEAEFAGKGYGDLKSGVAEAVVAGLEPLRSRYQEFAAHPDHLDTLLKHGAERAQAVANKTLQLVKERVGLG